MKIDIKFYNQNVYSILVDLINKSQIKKLIL